MIDTTKTKNIDRLHKTVCADLPYKKILENENSHKKLLAQSLWDKKYETRISCLH